MAELIISLVLLVVTILFLDPLMVLMPHSALYFLIAAFVIAFAVFAGFIWRERARDEREELHRMTAARVGYIAGTAWLLVGIVTQAFQGHTDPWLIGALALMVIAKLLGLLWNRAKR